MSTLIPYAKVAIAQTLAWFTDVLRSYSGLENRISLLDSPRESWDLQIAVDHELDRRALRKALYSDPVSPWHLPIDGESLVVQDDVVGVTVVVDATYADWISNGRAVYVEGDDPDDPDGRYEATISGFLGPTASTAITLSAGPPGSATFSAGIARIMPVAPVYLDDASAYSRQAASPSTGLASDAEEDVGAGVWNAKAASVSFPPFVGTGATLATFDSLVVLDRRPIVESALEEQTNSDGQRLDYGALVAQFWSRPTAEIGRALYFLSDGDADRQFWKLFLLTVRGRQVAFLLPTWQPDVDLVSQPAAAATTLHAYRNPGFGTWFDASHHAWLQLEHSDGSFERAKVSSVVNNGDGTETIHVTAGLVGPTVDRVSMMELARLGEDQVTLRHQAGGQFVFSLHGVVVRR
jgi:hypothetical protein